MTLVDMSMWVNHLRASDPILVSPLEYKRVVMHPMGLGIGCHRQAVDPGSRLWNVAADLGLACEIAHVRMDGDARGEEFQLCQQPEQAHYRPNPGSATVSRAGCARPRE